MRNEKPRRRLPAAAVRALRLIAVPREGYREEDGYEVEPSEWELGYPPPPGSSHAPEDWHRFLVHIVDGASWPRTATRVAGVPVMPP